MTSPDGGRKLDSQLRREHAEAMTRIETLKAATQARRDAEWLATQGRPAEAAAENTRAANLDRAANVMPSGPSELVAR